MMSESIDEEVSERRSCPQKIWDAWVSACLHLHQGLELLFQKLAEKVGNWPKVTIAISFLIAAVLTTGMHKYKMEKRSDRLFIPKESRSISDLDKAAAYFPMKFRAEEIVLTYSNQSNVLTSTLFKKLLELDRAVANLPNTKDLCVQYKINLTSRCSTLNVLELFNYSASKMRNVGSFMQSVYKNETVFMTNGKLAKLNFPEMFGRINLNSNGDFVSAKSVRIVYFMKYHTTDSIYDEVMKWEDSYIKYLKNQQGILEKQGIKLYFYAYRSLDDSISESALNDMQLIIVAFVLMVLFCVLMNVRFRKPVNGHVLLTMAGILTVFLGIGASFGLVMYTNTPFIGIVAVLPFMVLGVGIDDMFILVDTLDQRQPHLQGTVRLVATLSSAGSSILMTTLTDLIAFAISTVTDFRGIEYFCLYSALAITFVFILMVTFFLAFMKLDINRVENWKNDVIPCRQQESKQNPWYMEFSNLSSQIMFTWGKILMKTPVKIGVVLFGAGSLAVAIYGTTFLDQSFDSSTLGKDGSYQKNFFDIKRKLYSQGQDVGIYVLGEHDYSDTNVQKQFLKLSEIAKNNNYTIIIKHLNYSSNWLESYISWADQSNRSIAGSNFTKHLDLFLKEPKYKVHQGHLRFASNSNNKIIASRIIVRTKDNYESTFRKNAMLTLRADLDAYGKLNAFPSTLVFIYFEQFVVILRDTVRNLAVSGCAVLLVTLPYLIHPGVALLVVIGFVSLVFELLAIMYIWGVSLNSISMIVIVMAIGFSVDYSAHIAHAYIVSLADTPEERVIDALQTMGASVAMGGFSTFLGMLSTAFASSEVFRIFFKMIFTIVVLGMLHGLFFLPVFLSIFCRTKISLPHGLAEKEEISREITKSPQKSPTSSSVYHSPVNQKQSGKIGSKIIPVSPASSELDDRNNNA